MDRLDKLINNRRMLTLLLIWLVLLILIAVLSWFGTAYLSDIIIRQQYDTVFAAIGGGKFGSIPSAQEINTGADILSVHGINADTPVRMSALWKPLHVRLFLISLTAASFIDTIWLLTALHFMFAAYDDMEEIRQSCIAIAEDITQRCKLKGGPDSCERRLAESVNSIARRVEFLNNDLDKSHREVRDFLTDFSHQLKTYLSVVRLDSDMLSELDDLPNEQRHQLSDEIQNSLDAMEELVRESLKLARLEAGSVEYSMETCSLADTCALALKRLEPLLRQHNITAVSDITDNILINHDRIWLSEAIENIIKNSADHSGCSHIGISGTQQPGLITLIITDNGKGIPQSSIPSLFRRFSRKSGSTGLSSTGIGMSIAQKIVRAHDGDIMVYSSEGEGTRFELAFICTDNENIPEN